MAEPIDYARDVRPILTKQCVACHGATKQSAELRLDTHAGIVKGGNSGPAVVAKNGAGSRLIQAVTGSSKDVTRMPPKGAVVADDIATLRRWIDEGAIGPAMEEAVAGGPISTHWSFQPIRRPVTPAVLDKKWIRNPIDAFILAELEPKKVRPSPEAPPTTLLRRLHLDLTGLPPTIDDIEQFLKAWKANPDQAYEAAIDRLLASPHYGEMQARQWLDLARYADSNGFNIDAPRSIWKYRDWVIDALNRDMPFDRFTIEQLAGDLLPNATREQKIATGFHRNTLINQEGGIDLEQFRVESVVDRVNTTGSVWLGVTIGCCQCHDHKFDAFSQREYYQFFAFFNSTEDANNTGPTVQLPTQEMEEKENALSAQLVAAEKKLRDLDKAMPAAVKSNEDAKKDREALVKEIASLKKQNADHRKSIPSLMVMRELPQPRPSHVFIRGDFLRLGAAVTPDVPEVLPALKSNNPKSIPDRLDLARWLVSNENPLTPRVTMNRLWMRYFPKGLVDTE